MPPFLSGAFAPFQQSGFFNQSVNFGAPSFDEPEALPACLPPVRRPVCPPKPPICDFGPGFGNDYDFPPARPMCPPPFKAPCRARAGHGRCGGNDGYKARYEQLLQFVNKLFDHAYRMAGSNNEKQQIIQQMQSVNQSQASASNINQIPISINIDNNPVNTFNPSFSPAIYNSNQNQNGNYNY